MDFHEISYWKVLVGTFSLPFIPDTNGRHEDSHVFLNVSATQSSPYLSAWERAGTEAEDRSLKPRVGYYAHLKVSHHLRHVYKYVRDEVVHVINESSTTP
jgi:hypothetical protein